MHISLLRWIHDYQDACVDKLERFIRGEAAPSGRAATHSTSSLSGLDGLASPSGCSTQNILHTAADKKAFEGPSSCPILNASESWFHPHPPLDRCVKGKWGKAG